MKVIVDVDIGQFGKEVLPTTIQDVAQDIINRYCNVEYYNTEELERIAKNQFGEEDIYDH